MQTVACDAFAFRNIAKYENGKKKNLAKLRSIRFVPLLTYPVHMRNKVRCKIRTCTIRMHMHIYNNIAFKMTNQFRIHENTKKKRKAYSRWQSIVFRRFNFDSTKTTWLIVALRFLFFFLDDNDGKKDEIACEYREICAYLNRFSCMQISGKRIGVEAKT